MKRLPRRLSYPVLLWLAILAQASLCFIFALTRYTTFKASGYDIGNFTQVLYNLLHGNGLTTTINYPYVTQPWLAVHFSPVLYAIAPLYALLPHPETLLALHAFAIAAAAWPLYYALKRAGCSEAQAFVLALLYLINPFVLNAGVWDFHEIAFAPLAMAGALWALLAHRRAYFLACCVLLMMVKEHYGLAVLGLGTLWALHHRERVFGYGVAALGGIVFVLVLGWIMPGLSSLGHHYMTEGNTSNNRYGWLTHPSVTGKPLWWLLIWQSGQDIFYVGLLGLSWLLLPFLAPLWLLPGLGDLVANGLSLNPIMRLPTGYHNAALIVVLAVAAGRALVMRYPSGRFTREMIVQRMAVLALVASYVFLPLPAPGSANLWELGVPQFHIAPDDRQALKDIKGLIPANAAVAAQNNVAAHMAARRELYEFPAAEDEGGARWLVLRLRYPYRSEGDVFGAVLSVEPPRYFAAVEQKLADHSWGIVYFRHDWLVLARGRADAPGMRDARPAARRLLSAVSDCYGNGLAREEGRPLPAPAAECAP